MNHRCHHDRWRLDAAEAFSSGPDCTIIAGTGFGKRPPFTMPLLVKADQFRGPGLGSASGVGFNSASQHYNTMVADSTVIAKKAYDIDALRSSSLEHCRVPS
ncbi:hypothetical protein AZE42_08225 [Rhizopogon vesiculosus]|uniref:Uncharacterized protein n=1 Tax=Rhizopogon vesiculosus TaxID=180088 RepID=A0A1J8QTR6_9AGAM|nr:hypothetical protein AZE42_08225 [Rhizopogon vesiculosus]